MPYEDPDASDPQELIGVVLPSDADSRREMACAVAEEFARMGHDGRGIMRLFRNPFYAGAHGAYRALGHDAIAAIIEEAAAVWGRVRWNDRDAD